MSLVTIRTSHVKWYKAYITRQKSHVNQVNVFTKRVTPDSTSPSPPIVVMSVDDVIGDAAPRRSSSAPDLNRRRSTVGSVDGDGDDDGNSRAPVERSSSRASVASTSSAASLPTPHVSTTTRASAE